MMELKFLFCVVTLLWCGVLTTAVDADASDTKIAFLFMARGPMPLEDIWHEFFRWKANQSHYNIHVHVHKGFNYPTTSFFHGHELKEEVRAGGWGTMGQVQGIKALVREGLKDPKVEWVTLMSESCLPLHNFNTMRNALLGFDKSIVNACDMGIKEMEGDTRWRPGLDEVGFKHEWWRKSGTWFALKRKHAQVFVDETKTERGWEKVPCCDEHYLPSVLAMHGFDNETTCTDGFSHVHWPSLSAMHPHTYGGDEITAELFQHLSTPNLEHKGFAAQCSGVPDMCHFTARKFGPASKYQILENIDLILSDDDEEYDGNPWDHHQDKFRYNKTADAYYLIENGNLREIPDNFTLQSLHHFKINDEHGVDTHTQALTPLDLNSFPLAQMFPTRKDGQLIKAPKNNWIFLVKGGKRRGIPNMDTLKHLGLDISMVKILPASDIEQIVLGDPMPDVNESSSGSGGDRHPKKKAQKEKKEKHHHELGDHGRDHLPPKNSTSHQSLRKEGDLDSNKNSTSQAQASNPAIDSNTSSNAQAGSSFLYESEVTDSNDHLKQDQTRLPEDVEPDQYNVIDNVEPIQRNSITIRSRDHTGRPSSSPTPSPTELSEKDKT